MLPVVADGRYYWRQISADGCHKECPRTTRSMRYGTKSSAAASGRSTSPLGDADFSSGRNFWTRYRVPTMTSSERLLSATSGRHPGAPSSRTRCGLGASITGRREIDARECGPSCFLFFFRKCGEMALRNRGELLHGCLQTWSLAGFLSWHEVTLASGTFSS